MHAVGTVDVGTVDRSRITMKIRTPSDDEVARCLQTMAHSQVLAGTYVRTMVTWLAANCFLRMQLQSGSE